MGLKVLQAVTRGYIGLQAVRRCYGGLQGIAWGYK